MIVERAARLRDFYEQIADLDKVSGRVKQIGETREALEALDVPVVDAVTALGLTRGRVGDEEWERLARELRRVAGLIQSSERQFGGNRRQVVDLGKVERALKATQDAIDQAWQGYARGQVQGYRELLVIVRRLPNLASQAAELQTALAGMEPVSGAAPRSDVRLQAFDASLERVRVQARAFDGLSESVRAFLSLVAMGQATLADVVPETMAWLDEHGYLTSFAVGFGGEGAA